jgi:ABC-type transport system substrate-binding protein
MGSMAMEGDPLGVPFPADPYDPAQAKKLLAEAGYTKGVEGGRFYPYEGGYWPYGEQVMTYWKAVGINVETVLLDRPAWFANRQGGKMKGALFIDRVAPGVPFRPDLLRQLPRYQGALGSIPDRGQPEGQEGFDGTHPEDGSRENHVHPPDRHQFAGGVRSPGERESL